VQKTGWRRSKTNPNRSTHRRKDPLPYLRATEFSSFRQTNPGLFITLFGSERTRASGKPASNCWVE
jgi:hypothetical protein